MGDTNARKLAGIQTVIAVEPILGSDVIEKIRVLGGWTIVKKGKFALGDPVVYYGISAILPDRARS